MKIGKRIAERTEDFHAEAPGQTEYESFFSVSPVTSVLMPFSVSSAVSVPVAMAVFVVSVSFVADRPGVLRG
jgi:hypothetical protein